MNHRLRMQRGSTGRGSLCFGSGCEREGTSVCRGCHEPLCADHAEMFRGACGGCYCDQVDQVFRLKIAEHFIVPAGKEVPPQK
jgi:hypothetical protein